MQYKTKNDETVELSKRSMMIVPRGTTLTLVQMKPMIFTDGNMTTSKTMAFCSVEGWPPNLLVAFDPDKLEMVP